MTPRSTTPGPWEARIGGSALVQGEGRSVKPAVHFDEACAALGVSVRTLRRDADRGARYAVYLFKHSMGGGKGRPRSWTEKRVEEAQRLREAIRA